MIKDILIFLGLSKPREQRFEPKEKRFEDFIDSTPTAWESTGVKSSYLVVKSDGKRDHLISEIARRFSISKNVAATN